MPVLMTGILAITTVMTACNAPTKTPIRTTKNIQKKNPREHHDYWRLDSSRCI